MTIHEFVKGREKVVVLIRNPLVMWDYFEYVITLLKKHFRQTNICGTIRLLQLQHKTAQE